MTLAEDISNLLDMRHLYLALTRTTRDTYPSLSQRQHLDEIGQA